MQKGPLDVKVDAGALNETIVLFNQYRNEIKEKVTIIQQICQNMDNEESLQGGDGDIIRENFAKIAKGCSNIAASADHIAKSLNDKLAKAINMRHGATLGDSTDNMDKATKKAGVFKE